MCTCKGAVKLLKLEYRPAEPIGDVLVSAAILILAVNILMLTNLEVFTYKFPGDHPHFQLTSVQSFQYPSGRIPKQHN